ncbi:hypothetical protein [Paraburkholderia rhizosphaerae]|uniref:Restriction endonuclease n=1 Tax=Paraburkholderia rhizosphaerae TaxID=480658 RepID=A0A4R8LPF4_9BURK|nr:hypothetical protein [Paraburkholderia rhizosphaerae]TDY48116.1 hypothetical protein BX592_11150 [Paraburkholderia rhizosphaerae]
MVAATRTLNPLHFEDLEPKRFEDLIRQLVYDFKPWRRLEATGRAGSDDGFDARGYEIVETEPPSASETDDEEVTVVGSGDRLWLVQCKRERAIGPTKLLQYLNEIRLAHGEVLHGIIFAAACDFSKTARDRFRHQCAAMGLQEWHLWGKAEIEDRLYRPENDGLLFAYFGVSLTIRRRSQRTELRAKLAMKRKAIRLLESAENSTVLLRSPDATTYPDHEEILNFDKQPQWFVRKYLGLCHDGLEFLTRRHFAYLADDEEIWDAMFCCNEAINLGGETPWPVPQIDSAIRAEALRVWKQLPAENRVWLDVVAVIPFESILDIDDIGDEFVSDPHIYVPFNGESGPFAHACGRIARFTDWSGPHHWIQDEEIHRVDKFPAHLRHRPVSQS